MPHQTAEQTEHPNSSTISVIVFSTQFKEPAYSVYASRQATYVSADRRARYLVLSHTGTAGSPKFGGKSQIALSSGHEYDTQHHHGARRRHFTAAPTDAADGAADVDGRPFSRSRQLGGAQSGLGQHHLAQLHFVSGRSPPVPCRALGRQSVVHPPD